MNQPNDEIPPQNQLPEPYASMERLKPTTPWVSYLLLGITIALFVAYKIPSQPLGDLPLSARDIWLHGQYWQIITDAFVHASPMHVAFNLYVFYLLAPLVERQMGWFYFILFVLASDLVSSSAQLAWGDSSMGISGIIYAFIGYMILLRHRYLEFALFMHPGNIKFFVGWLFVCIIIKWLNILPIANTAHFTGILFGIAVGAVVANRKRLLWGPIAAVMLLLSFIPPFWAPWTNEFLILKSCSALEHNNPALTIDYCNQLLNRDPDNASALHLRGAAYLLMGQEEKGVADQNAARKLNPNLLNVQIAPHNSSQNKNPD